MSENMEAVGAEVTTPETAAENVADTPAADTQLNEAAQDTQTVTTPGEDETDQEAQPGEAGAEQPPEEQPAFSLPVRFNHKNHNLTTEQATAYAQMGMKYEAEAEQRDKLARLAAGTGKTVAEMIDMLAASQDKLLKRRLLERCHGDQEKAALLLEKEMARRNAAYEEGERQRIAADENEEKALTDRLAEQFVELQKEFPELTAFDGLPQEVVDTALDKDIHLLDAYLRYQRKEGRRVEQNRAASTAAAKASAGSQSGNVGAGEEDPAIKSLRNSIRRAL